MKGVPVSLLIKMIPSIVLYRRASSSDQNNETNIESIEHHHRRQWYSWINIEYVADRPHGIFVDINFTLYVADHTNSRVQRFALGEVNGVYDGGSGKFSINSDTMSKWCCS